MTGTKPNAKASPSWSEIVERIRRDDQESMETLYRAFRNGIRFYLYRRVGPQEVEDRIHESFLCVVHAIRRGEVREPERLMGFVRTVVRRQVAAHIDQAVQARRHGPISEAAFDIPDHAADFEPEIVEGQQRQFGRNVLQMVSDRDREVLERFYLMEQSQEQICRQMRLTHTQFRLLKSRAKARFGDAGRRCLERRTSGEAAA